MTISIDYKLDLEYDSEMISITQGVSSKDASHGHVKKATPLPKKKVGYKAYCLVADPHVKVGLLPVMYSIYVMLCYLSVLL